MANRALKTALWLAGVSGIISVLISADPGGFSVSVSPERTASAESAGAQLLYSVVADRSEARYRVREQLAGLSFPNDAVGTTSAVEGSISLDAQGRVLSGDSRFSVDLRLLRSDEARRDNYLRRNTLETGRYPTVVFVPSEVRGLRFPLPQTGAASFDLVGDLTVRDVTRRIVWDAAATFAGPDVTVRARTAFRFADFGLRVPRVSVVLSVEDNIQLEIDLLMRRRA